MADVNEQLEIAADAIEAAAEETEEETETDEEWQNEVREILSDVVREQLAPIAERWDSQLQALQTQTSELANRPTSFPEMMSAMERLTAMVSELTQQNTALLLNQQALQTPPVLEPPQEPTPVVVVEPVPGDAGGDPQVPATEEPVAAVVPPTENPRRKHRVL